MSTVFGPKKEKIRAIDGVSFYVCRGEMVGIVGESGCGKSVTSQSIMRLYDEKEEVSYSGTVRFEGENLMEIPYKEMDKIRGNRIAMIFQDVGAALDPIQKIRNQYEEAIEVHEKLPRHRYVEKAVEMLKKMHLTDPNRVMNSYPFELSGGMKQRVGIAMGMTAKPKLLLADEPTSALDVTIQAQVVHQMKELRDKYGVTIILVTHNMGVASYLSDKIGVMCRSKMVEFGTRDEIIYHPKEQYTKDLLEAVPKMGGERFAK